LSEIGGREGGVWADREETNKTDEADRVERKDTAEGLTIRLIPSASPAPFAPVRPVNQLIQPRNVVNNNHALRQTMTAVTLQASAATPRPFTKSPILDF
jgi:hypothetical protein